MRERSSLFGIVGIGLLGALLVGYVFVRKEPSVAPVIKHLRFSIEVTNQSAQPIGNAQVFIARPLDLAGKQKLSSMKSSAAKLGQNTKQTASILALNFSSVAPYGSRTANVDFSLAMGARSAEASANRRFLSSSDLIKVDSAVAQRYAAVFLKNDHTPQSFSKWLSSNLKYVGYIAEARGSDYALSQMAGDCTEYSAALVAVLRANQIPARIMVGMVMPEQSTIVRSSDYHNWVEYYDGRRWQALDPQYGVVAETSSYVAFHVMDESKRAPAQRFFSSSNDLSIKIL